MLGFAIVKEHCFETELRRVYKESPVQRNVINIECFHQAINTSARNKAPFHFKELNKIFVHFTIHRHSDIFFEKVQLMQS